MCGIGGLLDVGLSADALESAARRLQGSLAHRGPDGAGLFFDPPRGVALVQTRLAIQDPAAAIVPLQLVGGRRVLLFNGEIYNFRELRVELQAQGIEFRTETDTEVLFHWLDQFGAKGLSRLRGMFALAWWNCAEASCLLARDPFGIKPLYFAHRQGGLLFASEIRALLATGCLAAEIDPRGLDGFLATGSVPGPGTLLRGVEVVPPGHYLVWRTGDWNVAPFDPLTFTDAPAWIERPSAALSEVFSDSLMHHFRSDVPVGLALSGGLDSSALLARAGTLCLPLKTFSIASPGRGEEDATAAARLARTYGSVHYELELSDDEARAGVEPFLQAIDQPTIDGFNTYSVARLAARHGIKVLLSGIGGDEWLGGYPTFRHVPRLRTWGEKVEQRGGAWGKALLGRVGPYWPGARGRRVAEFLAGPPTLARSYQAVRGLFTRRERERIARALGLEGFTAFASTRPEPVAKDPRAGVAELETTTYLQHQLLRDADVFGMAHGVEIRVPFIDREMFRLVQQIAPNDRFAPGKSLLRAAVSELPTGFARGPKRGFTLPFARWLASKAWQDVTAIAPRVPGLDQGTWARRWSLVVLGHWLRQNRVSNLS